jgi:hypothetical protein
MLENKELVKESEWMRTYRVGPNTLYYESKFLKDHLEISVQSLVERWPHLAEQEHLEFAFAFAAKAELSKNDEEILAFLMRAGNEAIWSCIAVTLVRHPNREAVLQFFLNLVERPRPECANYFQALELLKDKRAVPVLRRFYDAYREQQKAGQPSELLSELQWETDYLRLCRALLVLDGGYEFEMAIKEMLNHPEQEVRTRAERFLRRTEN